MPKPAETQRTCIATGLAGTRQELLRFVRSPEGDLVFDLHAKLPGRGIWVAPSRAAVELAMAKNLFPRGAKEKVRVPSDLAERVGFALRRHALELLSLCRKSGVLVAGFEKVQETLAKDPQAVLLHASDAGQDGKGKLAGKSEREAILCFTRDELAEITGRDNPVHLALLPSGIASQFLQAVRRLTGFEG